MAISLPPQLPIIPFTRPVRGSVTLPGSKSITNRALILAALGTGTVTLKGALFSRDSRIMIAALQALGFKVEYDEKAFTIQIEGRGGVIPNREARIDIGNAGTAARFLTAFVCLRPDGVYHFDGDEAMRRRPIGALLEALESQGAKADSRSFPFTLRTSGLKGGLIKIDASESSQMLSALLMIAPFAAEAIVIQPIGKTRMPFVHMTDRLMTSFAGISPSYWPNDGSYHPVLASTARFRNPGVFAIEPDASAASYFLTLPLIAGGEIDFPDLISSQRSLQGDTRYMEVLTELGMRFDHETLKQDSPDFLQLPRKVIDIRARRSETVKPKGLTRDFREFSDTFLTLAAIAPLLDGPTKISGIAHTRKQETDRVAGMARELQKLGQHVVETEDSLEIHPRPLKAGVTIETYHDHRFAMSFGILGCHDLLKNGQPWLTINDPACCAKTFPEFFEVLEGLRGGAR